jgi:hypothetical protein
MGTSHNGQIFCFLFLFVIEVWGFVIRGKESEL